MKVNLTSARHILPIAAFLVDGGEPLPPLLERAGLPGSCLDDPGKPVPTAALWRFRELAAIRTGSPNLTLEVMIPLALSELGPVGRSLLGAPTLRKTIEDFVRLARAESSTTVLELAPYRAGGAFFSVRFNLGPRGGEWQAELYLLMWMLKIARLVAPGWSPPEIWCLERATPERIRAIESLAARPRFDQRCVGFPIPESMLARPQQGHRPRSPVGQVSLWSNAPSDSASGALRQLVETYADDRWLTLEEASDVLGTAPRTLQRELAAEDQSFSAIVEDARLHSAVEMLEGSDASLTEIARSLGYANLSNFNRAFRRWAAVSPRRFRAEQRGAQGAPVIAHR